MDSNFLKYLRRTKNDMLIYFGKDLTPIRYEDYDFQLDPDFKSQHLVMFSLKAEELLFKGVSSKVVLLVLLWKLNM